MMFISEKSMSYWCAVYYSLKHVLNCPGDLSFVFLTEGCILCYFVGS